MIQITEKGIVIAIRVIPNSSKNCIINENDIIKIKVTASPVDNKANQALIDFLSKELGIPKSNIEIIKGNTSKEKKILVRTVDDKIKVKIVDKLTKSI